MSGYFVHFTGFRVRFNSVIELYPNPMSCTLVLMQMSGDRTPTWTPHFSSSELTQMHTFRLDAEQLAGCFFPGTVELHEWSIVQPQEFWSLVWDFFSIQGFKGKDGYIPSELPSAQFFPQATLNLAENYLQPWINSEESAVICMGEGADEVITREVISGRELTRRVGSLSQLLRERGVQPGDRIGLIMPVGPDALVGMLAALAVGAVMSSVSPELGALAILERFGQLSMSAVLATTTYQFNGKKFDRSATLSEVLQELPSVHTVVCVGHDSENSRVEVPQQCTLLDFRAATSSHVDPVFEQLPFDHPAYILFSSGTTGKPKCLLHRAGGVLIKHLVELGLHADIKHGDRLLFYTTTSWMMWNWEISCLALGATLIVHDGAPTYPVSTAIFDSAVIAGATHVGVGASLLDHIKSEGDRLWSSNESGLVRQVLVTGSPLSVSTASWLAGQLGPEIMINPISGGTDLVGIFVGGDPTRPFFAGEMTGPALGVAVDVYTDSGRRAADNELGELVCLAPFPTVPLGIWGDTDGSRLRGTYFDVWTGVWVHGDRAVRSSDGGISILGRSDATLNVGGVRIGTAEIYAALSDHESVTECLAFGQEYNDDTRIVLLVVASARGPLDENAMTSIRTAISSACSPRHVPSIILEVPDLPKTQTGKISEIAIREAAHGREVKGIGALSNPESLKLIVELLGK